MLLVPQDLILQARGAWEKGAEEPNQHRNKRISQLRDVITVPRALLPQKKILLQASASQSLSL